MFETIKKLFDKKKEKTLEEIIIEMANDEKYANEWDIEGVNLMGKRIVGFEILPQDMIIIQTDETYYITHLSKLIIKRTPLKEMGIMQ